MSDERNIETLESLKREIKAVRANCTHTYHIIENAPPDPPVMNPEEVVERNNYFNIGLKEEIQNTNTQICTDDNLLTSQFLKEIKEKTIRVKQLLAFTKGTIHEVDAEINRLKDLIKVTNEAQSKPKLMESEVLPEHVQKAREKFTMMKNELHGLMQSLFPQCHEQMRVIMGELMSAKLIGPDVYLPITPENYDLIGFLKDMNIITPNPYNNMEVKLTYNN